MENFEMTLTIEQELFPSNHPTFAITYNNIASVYFSKEDFRNALKYYNKELEIRLLSSNLNYADLVMNYRNLSVIYYKLNKYADAFKMSEMARKTLIEKIPHNDNQLISLHNDLGEMYYLNHEYDTALNNYKEALRIGLKILPVDNEELISVYKNIDQLYFTSKITISTDYSLEMNCFTPLTYSTIGAIFNEMNDYERALLYYENAYHTELKMSSPNLEHIETYKTNMNAMKNKTSYFSREKFIQLMYTIYEYLFNSG
jgi:tetratricopeptide (TPR) repeat protein